MQSYAQKPQKQLAALELEVKHHQAHVGNAQVPSKTCRYLNGNKAKNYPSLFINGVTLPSASAMHVSISIQYFAM